MYENAIDLFKQCGLPERAVQAARQGIQVYPDGAYLWLLLGKTLQDTPNFAAPGEIEACLRQSLKANQGLFESADWMAIFLAEQHRYKEAADLMLEMEPNMADPSPALGRLAWIKRHSGEQREAAIDLAEVVRNAPWYSWGWDLLLTWLDEDKNWDLSSRLLDVVPARMLTDVAFRQKRLQHLEKRKVASSIVDAEWEELLRDFPEDVSLHLRRYDSLHEAGRRADAYATLRRVVPIAEGNVYLLARLVEVECEKKNLSSALDHALSACFTRPEESPWPVNRVWEHMRTNGLVKEFAERLGSGCRKVPSRHAVRWFSTRSRF
jgi:hypothetical protein